MATITFTVKGTTYIIDDDDLTLGEMEEVERTGRGDGGTLSTIAEMRALMVIAMRRAGEAVNPEAIKELRRSEWTVDREEEAEANGGPPPNRAARRAAAKAGGSETIRESSGSPSTATTSV